MGKPVTSEQRLQVLAGAYLITQDALHDAVMRGAEVVENPAISRSLSIPEATALVHQQGEMLQAAMQEYIGGAPSEAAISKAIQHLLDDLALSEQFPAGKVHLVDLADHTAAKLLEFGVDGRKTAQGIGGEAAQVDEFFTRLLSRRLKLEYPDTGAWTSAALLRDLREKTLADKADELGLSYHAPEQGMRL